MNFVVIKHVDNGKYLFMVPDGVELDAGTAVLCDTSRGKNQHGVCATGTFMADPEVICPLWGTMPEKLRRVTSVLREFQLQWPEEQEGRTETEEAENDDLSFDL